MNNKPTAKNYLLLNDIGVIIVRVSTWRLYSMAVIKHSSRYGSVYATGKQTKIFTDQTAFCEVMLAPLLLVHTAHTMIPTGLWLFWP
jgi:hypothetical protein